MSARAGTALPALAVGLGALLLNAGPLAVRFADLGPQACAFWRFALAAPVLFAWWLFAKKAETAPLGDAKTLRLLIAAGAVFGIDIALLHAAFDLTTVANASLISNLTPIVAAVAGWLIFRERVTAIWAAGAGLALGGVVLLSLSRSKGGEAALTGDLIALGATSAYATYLILMRMARARVGTMPALMVTTAASAVVALCVALALEDRLIPPDAHSWALVAALGLVGHIGGQGLIAYGLGKLDIATATVLLWLQPVGAAALGWSAFGEALGPLALAGAALVLGGVYVAQTKGGRA
jgi:drug/metabolite transporter (DMT)-like permease